MRAPPARSTTAAAACTPSVPPCPTSSCVRVRAARRGRRPSTEDPRTAEAQAPPPARHSVQEVQMQGKDCPPKIGTPPVPQTLQFPEVKALIFNCYALHRPRNAMSPRAIVHLLW